MPVSVNLFCNRTALFTSLADGYYFCEGVTFLSELRKNTAALRYVATKAVRQPESCFLRESILGNMAWIIFTTNS